MTRPRVALFIDAENASPVHLPECIAYCEDKLGKLTIRRCYGHAAALKGWEAAIAKHHLLPMQTPPGTAKANASDFALTIDAVSLLHRGLFDHAAIASSDADFTLLAVHIREHGKGIYGFGEAKAKASLKSAFDHFEAVGAAVAASKPAAKKAVAQPTAPKPANQTAVDAKWLLSVFNAVRESADNCDLQALARALAKSNKDYKKGYRTLDKYLQRSGLFEIKDKKVYRAA